jgi:hypothetical protein
MWQIYRKIERGELSRAQLEYWRDRTTEMAGPWASKVHYACVLQLEGIAPPLPLPDKMGRFAGNRGLLRGSGFCCIF